MKKVVEGQLITTVNTLNFHAHLQIYYARRLCKPIVHKSHIFSLNLFHLSKHLFVDVSDFGAKKKKKLNLDTSGLISSPHLTKGKGQFLTLKNTYVSKFFTPRAQKIVKRLGGGGGMLRFRFDQRIIVWTTKSCEEGFERSKAVVPPYSKDDSV